MLRWICLVLLLLAAAPARAAEVSLGRLFFTPAQRLALEEARRKNTRAEVLAVEKPTAPPVRNVSVSGVVRRSDGESTVWVNGKPVDGATADGLKVRITAGQQAAVVVMDPAQGRTVRLKVGQRADVLTGHMVRAPPGCPAATRSTRGARTQVCGATRAQARRGTGRNRRA
jgi:hypothetical protein